MPRASLQQSHVRNSRPRCDRLGAVVISLQNSAKGPDGTRMTIEAYYRERASEYDEFYRIREHSTDLARLRAWLVRCARGRTILEVAAGTGYWTKVVASVAKAVTAT